MFAQKSGTVVESFPALVMFLGVATLVTWVFMYITGIKSPAFAVLVFLAVLGLVILAYWFGREKLHGRPTWSEEFRQTIPESYGLTFNCLCSGLGELPRFICKLFVSCFR